MEHVPPSTISNRQKGYKIGGPEKGLKTNPENMLGVKSDRSRSPHSQQLIEATVPETENSVPETLTSEVVGGARPNSNIKKVKLKTIYGVKAHKQTQAEKPGLCWTEPDIGLRPLESVGTKATFSELDYGPRLKMKPKVIESKKIIDDINPRYSEPPNINPIVKCIPGLDSSDETTVKGGFKDIDGQRHLCINISVSQLQIPL